MGIVGIDQAAAAALLIIPLLEAKKSLVVDGQVSNTSASKIAKNRQKLQDVHGWHDQ
jgi:hypothetical protein